MAEGWLIRWQQYNEAVQMGRNDFDAGTNKAGTLLPYPDMFRVPPSPPRSLFPSPASEDSSPSPACRLSYEEPTQQPDDRPTSPGRLARQLMLERSPIVTSNYPNWVGLQVSLHLGPRLVPNATWLMCSGLPHLVTKPPCQKMQRNPLPKGEWSTNRHPSSMSEEGEILI